MLNDEIDTAKHVVKTDSYQMSVGELVNMYRDGELIINPDFQRLFRWELGQKSKLIESLLLGIPLPSIFVFEKEDAKWELIDGLQRVSTLLEFMGLLRDSRPTALEGTAYLPSLDNVVWELSENVQGVSVGEQQPLSADLKLAIRRSRISVEILKRPSSNETKYDLFQRLNAGGTQANAQELRNAIVIMANPTYHTFMKRCADYEPFLTVIAASDEQLEKQRHMEYVSRFLVHCFVKYDNKLDVEAFIDKSIVSLATSGETNIAEAVFTDTFNLLNEAFGGNALRRFAGERPTGRVVLAAFECIAVGIGRNIEHIRGKDDPVEYVRRRILEFWRNDNIGRFFVAGLRGTVRIQRTIPFGGEWFAQ